MARQAPDPATFAPRSARPTRRRALTLGDFLKSSSGRALTREVVRGVFGTLKRGF